jgi:hypothetical protein
MANWIPITLADIEDAKLAKLVTALRERALKAVPPQTDPTSRLTQKVVNRIRRKIGNNPNNKLDADATKIPKGLLGVAIVLILAEMKGRLEMALTTDENKAVDRADADLQAVADGEAVEEPDDPIAAPVQTTSGTPTISECRREKRNARNSG